VVVARDTQRPVLIASLTGRRVPLTDRALVALLLRMPLLTVKVIVAIHWHALRMWMSGFVFHPQPAMAKVAARADAGQTGR
jgi:uncharacterized protein